MIGSKNIAPSAYVSTGFKVLGLFFVESGCGDE